MRSGDTRAVDRLRRVLRGYDASARARQFQRDEHLLGLQEDCGWIVPDSRTGRSRR
jgi:hypothetical protein